MKNPVDTLIQLAHPVARNVGSTTNRVLSIIETPLPGRISNLEASISQQLLQLSWQPGSGRSDYYDVSLRELDISKTPRSGWTSPSRTNVTSLTLPISQQFFDSAGILQVQVTPGNMSGLGESIVKEFSYSPVSSPTSSIRDCAKSPVLGGSLVYILGKVNSADLFWTEEPKLALSARFTIRARSESSPDWRSIGVSDARQVRVNLAGSLSNWFEFQVSGEDGVLSTPLSNVLRLSIATTTTTVAVGGRVKVTWLGRVRICRMRICRMRICLG